MKKLFALAALLVASPAWATDPQFGAIRVEVTPNVRHAFVSAQSQSANANLVSRDEWNAAHTAPAQLIVAVPTGLVWPAQPAAVTEFCGGSTDYRWRANLTNTTTIRLTAQVLVAGAATSALRLQYTTTLDGSGGWDYLDSVSGPSVSIAASGVAVSASVSVATAAKADVLLRLVGINGDGAGGAACYSGIKAATATALAANGANCSAGSFAGGVDASGAAEDCTALPTTITGTANQITASAATGAVTLSIPTNPTLPGTTTGTFSGALTGNASTATALAANGANCSAGNYPLGVDASGAVESCTAVSAGITVGTTTITSGTDTRIPFNASGVYQEDAGLTYASSTDIMTLLGGLTVGSVTTAGRGTLSLRDTITGTSATSNFINVTSAFPGTLTFAQVISGSLFSTALDNDPNVQNGLRSVTTGTGTSSGGYFMSALNGEATNTGSGAFGVRGSANSTATYNVGVYGEASNSSATNRYAGYFSLGGVYPGAGNAALVANNDAAAFNIFEARDNGTAVLTVADTGAITWTNTLSPSGTGYMDVGPNGAGSGALLWATAITPDSPSLYTGTTSNSWLIAERTDGAYDFNNGACGTAACTDPGLIIHSAVQDTTQYNHQAAWGQAGGALKTLTESAATSVVRIPVAALEGTGGKLTYRVKAADATDVQIREGEIKFAVVNKAGTETCTLSGASEAADGSVVAASVGTLTYGITCDTTPANAVDIAFNAVSSLTQTTLNIQYFVTLTGVGQPARQ